MTNRALRCLAPLLVSCAAWLAAGHAHAMAKVAPAGKLRLHIDTEFLSWTQTRNFYEPGAPKDPSNPRFNVIGFGAGRPITGDGVVGSGFLYNSLIGVGLGYGIHRNLILGARLGFNFSNSKSKADPDPNDPNPPVNDARNGVFIGTFEPYLEILPIPEGSVLPYILVRTGFSGGTVTNHNGDAFQRSAVMSPTAGVGGGAHAFLTPFFSLDFGVTFDYRWFHSRTRIKDPTAPFQVQPVWTRASQGFTLAATIGISTWF